MILLLEKLMEPIMSGLMANVLGNDTFLRTDRVIATVARITG